MLFDSISDAAGGNKQHTAAKDTAKLDRETEDFHRMKSFISKHPTQITPYPNQNLLLLFLDTEAHVGYYSMLNFDRI